MLAEEEVLEVRGKIDNSEHILSRGNTASRRIVLDITEATLRQLDAYQRIKAIMRLEGAILHIGVRSWDLSKKRNVYLIGAGKACNAMAQAVDEILGDRLTAGFAIVKIREASDVFRRTKVFVGGHPLPNEEGLAACKEILDVVEGASKDDLFIIVISGGSSALMSYPVEGISLQDEIVATDVLLKSGAGILEINALRRHISRVNGGRLAESIQSVGAELIGIGISDAVGNPQTGDVSIPCTRYRGTPMGPDQTTLEDARRVVREYGLAQRLPKTVVDYLANCGPEGETPKGFPDNTYFLLNTVPDSIAYAKARADETGLASLVLTTFVEGEGKDVGTVLASIAREIQTNGRPIAAPCVVLSAGEATTRILDGDRIEGHGGPSQELVVGFALAAERAPGACLLSIDTEGTDGTTPVAGGIADSLTYARAREKGVDLRAALRGHACYEALRAIGDTVDTGNTGTNLCDLNVMYVPRPAN